MALFNMGRYIEHNINYSIVYDTMSRSLPNVVYFMLGVLPLYLGFLIFGYSAFWSSERFSSPSSTSVVLFSLAQGDIILDVFKDLQGFSFVLGHLYTYIFCLVFFS